MAELEHLAGYGAEPFRLDSDIQFLVYQLEAGESGTPHLQGYVQLSKRKRLGQVKALLSPRIHAEVARGKPAANYEYCTKPDGRLEGPFEYGSMASGQGTRNDIVDFVSRAKQGRIPERELIEEFGPVLAKYPRFVSTVTRHYNRPVPTTFVPRPGWQLDLSLILSGAPDARKVHWYWESVGNVGKSYYALNFVDRGGSFGYVVTGGRHADIYYAYADQKVVFFDWARDNEEAFPYRVIENFKNGYFLNTKYETHAHRFAPPHTVVFANFPPDESKLSHDRWDIKQI